MSEYEVEIHAQARNHYNTPDLDEAERDHEIRFSVPEGWAQVDYETGREGGGYFVSQQIMKEYEITADYQSAAFDKAEEEALSELGPDWTVIDPAKTN